MANDAVILFNSDKKKRDVGHTLLPIKLGGSPQALYAMDRNCSYIPRLNIWIYLYNQAKGKNVCLILHTSFWSGDFQLGIKQNAFLYVTVLFELRYKGTAFSANRCLNIRFFAVFRRFVVIISINHL